MIIFAIWISPIFSERAVEADYLAELRDSSESCRSIGRRRPTLLFLGDSHTYADWNFLSFQNAFPAAHIGSCGIGGLYFESVEYLVKQLVENELTPRTIIYGASLRQFATGKNKAEQTAEHSKLISEIKIRNSWLHPNLLDNLKQVYRALIATIPNLDFGSSSKIQTDKLRFHSPLVQSIDESTVTEVMSRIQNLSRRSWDEYLHQAKVEVGVYQPIAKDLCKLVLTAKIHLVVIELPESPVLNGLYSAEQKRNYRAILNRLEKCAILSVTEDDLAGTLANRHFVNRWADPEFPYQALGADHIGNIDGYNADLLFDLDHANLVGAELLTAKIIDVIRARKLEEQLTRAL